MMWVRATFAALAVALVHADAPPLVWERPEVFDPFAKHLGLPVLTGVTHRILYDPIPGAADGSGPYESLRHGMYNHHQRFVRNGNWLIVVWTNHTRDENGPGMRCLAKAGKVTPDSRDVDWGCDETLSELCPPAHPVKRRRNRDDTPEISGVFANGGLDVLENGRMFVSIHLKVCYGWSNDIRYHVGSGITGPIPDAHYQAYKSSGPNRKQGFRWDIYWYVGKYMREVLVEGAGKLVPSGPMYVLGKPPAETFQLTPTVTKRMLPLNEPYRHALPYCQAPQDLREAYSKGKRVSSIGRIPRYAPGTFKLAANGVNGLMHYTEFVRPDGIWVAVRDNLFENETYYAAVKNNRDDFYPPGRRTNLFGAVQPVAGELHNGGIWLIGSNHARTEAYITLSQDGVHFRKTWSLLSIKRKVTPGLCKTDDGAQYFHAAAVGPNIWVVYSIAKEQVGITKIPVALLTGLLAD
ncbi:MAG: hypothetical protein PHV28_15610 [Kiritimatiellae bacterium]|nr:hypothetical protein [Kiritimatiellia bacterium]